MLRKLRLHNFRTFLNAEVEFGHRHLLIGKNNSGKTNLCQALRFLGATASMKLEDAAWAWVWGGVSELTNWAFKGRVIDLSVTCELPFEDEPTVFQYDLSLESTSAHGADAVIPARLRLVKESLSVVSGRYSDHSVISYHRPEADQTSQHEIPEGLAATLLPATNLPDTTMLCRTNEPELGPAGLLFRRYLMSWSYHCLSPKDMRNGWREAGQGMWLYPHGENLATALFYLKNQDERRYRRVIERVKEFEPGLEAINFYVAPDQGILPFLSLRRRERASWQGLSDGTLRALALSYLIEQASSVKAHGGIASPVLLIEEPENGIYGGLLRKLLEDFENWAPEAQTIFTSHAPYFIDLFDNDFSSVTLLRRDRERTVVERLKPDQKLPSAGDRVTLAERFFAEMLG